MPLFLANARLEGIARDLRIVGMAAFACLVGVACGGSALSKDEYIAQADEICAAAETQAEELDQPTEPAEAETYANGLEKITQGYIADLRELEPPSDDEEALNDFIDKIEQAGQRIVEAIRTQSGSGNPAESYSEALHLAEEANEEAEEYGFESCGRSPVLEHSS